MGAYSRWMLKRINTVIWKSPWVAHTCISVCKSSFESGLCKDQNACEKKLEQKVVLDKVSDFLQSSDMLVLQLLHSASLFNHIWH